MGYKEKMKQAHQAGNDVPRLDILQRFEVKEDEKGKPVFQYYDAEAMERKNHAKAIEGVYVGRAFKLTCFDDELGSKGGSYFSSYYFKNNFVTLFKPVRGGIKRVVTGTMEAVEAYLTDAKGNPSKKMVLFVLTQGGVVEVHTNISIAIDQFKAYTKDKERLLDYMIKLSPKVYHKDNPDVGSKAKEILGKFADKNPPKYASLEQGKPITGEIAEKWDIESVCDEFLEWKEYRESQAPKEPEDADKKQVENDINEPSSSRDLDNPENLEDSEDDLPF